MTTAKSYRELAAECEARAEKSESPATRAEWINLANSYRRLADETDEQAAEKKQQR